MGAGASLSPLVETGYPADIRPPDCGFQRLNFYIFDTSLQNPFPEVGYPADIRPRDGFSVTLRMELVLVSLFKGDNAKIRQFFS